MKFYAICGFLSTTRHAYVPYTRSSVSPSIDSAPFGFQLATACGEPNERHAIILLCLNPVLFPFSITFSIVCATSAKCRFHLIATDIRSIHCIEVLTVLIEADVLTRFYAVSDACRVVLFVFVTVYYLILYSVTHVVKEKLSLQSILERRL